MRILFIVVLISFVKILETSLDSQNFLVYGPGLDSSISLPVRYFFVQLVNKNHENVTSFRSQQQDQLIEVTFQQFKTGKVTHFYHDVFYLNYGVFVIRYRLSSSVVDDNIIVTFKWLPTFTYIGNKSFLLKYPLYSEKCHCPQLTLKYWLDRKLKCPQSYDQIEEDFNNFESIHTEEFFSHFFNRFKPFTSVAVCRYIVRSNNIYRKCFGEHTGFRMFSDAALLSLSHKVILPDIDFLFNLGDWPLSLKNKQKFAIFSWCGSHDSYDIVIPSYETMDWVLEMMNRVYLDVFTVMKDSTHNWNQRIETAFWRGRDSSKSRLNLVRMSIRNREILDAALTNMFFFQNDTTLGTLKKPISFTEFFKYKYIINMDGTVAAYRFPLSLAGGSLVLKEQSKYYEFIYSQLKPDEHYISIKSDLSDLLDKLIWSKSHDKDCQRISENARQFVMTKFMPIDIFCYFGRVLEKYSNNSSKNPQIILSEDYELVTDKSDDPNCDCLKFRNNKSFLNDDL